MYNSCLFVFSYFPTLGFGQRTPPLEGGGVIYLPKPLNICEGDKNSRTGEQPVPGDPAQEHLGQPGGRSCGHLQARG